MSLMNFLNLIRRFFESKYENIVHLYTTLPNTKRENKTKKYKIKNTLSTCF